MAADSVVCMNTNYKMMIKFPIIVNMYSVSTFMITYTNYHIQVCITFLLGATASFDDEFSTVASLIRKKKHLEAVAAKQANRSGSKLKGSIRLLVLIGFLSILSFSYLLLLQIDFIRHRHHTSMI